LETRLVDGPQAVRDPVVLLDERGSDARLVGDELQERCELGVVVDEAHVVRASAMHSSVPLVEEAVVKQLLTTAADGRPQRLGTRSTQSAHPPSIQSTSPELTPQEEAEFREATEADLPDQRLRRAASSTARFSTHPRARCRRGVDRDGLRYTKERSRFLPV